MLEVPQTVEQYTQYVRQNKIALKIEQGMNVAALQLYLKLLVYKLMRIVPLSGRNETNSNQI